IGRFVSSLKGFNLSPIPNPAFPNTIDQYVSLDARLAWKPRGTNWELAVVGQNLLNSHHPEVGHSPTLQSPLVEIQRGVSGKLTYYWQLKQVDHELLSNSRRKPLRENADGGVERHRSDLARPGDARHAGG